MENQSLMINHPQSTRSQPQIQQNFQKDICESLIENKQCNKLKVINQICIDDKHILIANDLGLYIEKLRSPQSSRKKIVEGKIWDCVFIPKTEYIAYCVNNISQNEERKNLYIFNHKQEKLSARIKIEEQIEYIKANKHCIALGSLSNIYILHFPSLKPIYNGPAGNTIQIIFDLSYEGLTIGHNSFKKGELIIRNFSNIKKLNVITQRKKSIYSSKIKLQDKRKSSDTLFTQKKTDKNANQQQIIEPLLKIKAHIDSITQIKISPNGQKAVTASIKGTVLRIFSTKNGQKVDQFRIGYQLIKIVDVDFVPDGNILGCLSSKGNVLLFNVSMSKIEKQYQKQRLGHNIYTQNNPKSFFSILSFAYPPLNDSFSFNNFQLINPQFNEQQHQQIEKKMGQPLLKSQSLIEQSNPIKKVDIKRNSSIQQLDEEHHEQTGLQKNDLNDFSPLNESLISEEYTVLQKQTYSYKQLNINMQRRSMQVFTPLNSHNFPIKKSNSYSNPVRNNSNQKLRSRISENPMKRNASSLQKRTSNRSDRKNIEKNDELFERPFQNTVCKLKITQSNYVWVVKGFHLFGLKYDAFHGGQMILDSTKKLN